MVDKAQEERLAAALRDNLRRRKAQARDVDSGDQSGAQADSSQDRSSPSS